MNFKLTRIKTAVFAALLSFFLFLTTLQTHINGSENRYATDVGELQNALPRWGTIHFSGYPQYTFMGSLFVTVLRPFMQPAIASSLFSALWGAIAIGLLAWLMMELRIKRWIAGGTAVLFALSTSMWMDASIAEVHTMTMAFMFAILIAAVRFARDGNVSDLYWLAFLTGMGITHQRAVAFLGMGVLIIVSQRWRLVLSRLHILILLGLIGPLTYIYLPLRAWMGSDWLFSSPGTWEGLKALVVDTGHMDVLAAPSDAAGWTARLHIQAQLLSDDWPTLLWGIGLLGILIFPQTHRKRIGFTVIWLTFMAVALVIWEGYISDALLAIKMPITAIAAIGVAFLANYVARQQKGKYAVAVAGIALFAWLFFSNRPSVLAVTRDKSAFETVARVGRIDEAEDGRLQTVTTLWGHDYWALAYVQTYDNKFPHLNLITHDANFAAILARGDHLLTLEKTFYYRPLEEWERLSGGELYLSAPAPDIMEMALQPVVAGDDQVLRSLGNGVAVKTAVLTRLSPDELLLDLVWQAEDEHLDDYSVAVHLVTHDPPTGPQDILTQADSSHPVNGWYPTSRWQADELVRDQYLVHLPPDSDPLAVRLGMYRQLADGSYENSEWLSLPVNEAALQE